MNQTNIKAFVEQYSTFKTSEAYKQRMAQKTIVPVFRAIIWEVLKNEMLTNQHLTDLIQIFKFNCSNENFDNKLGALIADESVRKKLSEQAYKIGESGYTNAGKTGISGLSSKQLLVIRQFLLDAYKIKSKQDAIDLCNAFDNKNIPQVKKGIYSPWLYYINPEMFPIVNNSHQNFKKWLGLSNYYPTSIQEYHEINSLIQETDFGGLDYFAHHLSKDGKLNLRRVHYLNGSRLYKISHGVFVKRTDFVKSGIIKVLEQNNWISLSRYTGKGAGEAFEHDLKIGDFVYLCYGGDKMIAVAKVISDAKPFNDEYAALLGDEEEEWIYREIEPLYFPVDSNISGLKSFRSQTMPSGNSTFWEIKPGDLDYLNENLFIPKMNLEFLKSKDETSESNGDERDDQNFKIMFLNTILFGPPGTGKTFHSVSHSVAIVENKGIDSILAEDREEVKRRFDLYTKDGQIVFCTFHQSMNYEDFIEGIKPIEPTSEGEQLYYAVEDGIFKKICTEASFSYVRKTANAETEKVLDFSAEYDNFLDSINEQFSKGKKIELPTRSGGKLTVEGVSDRNNIWVRHIDGNRPYTVSKRRLAKLSQAFPALNDVTNINKQFRTEIGGSNSSAYWSILNAIRKRSSDLNDKSNNTIVGKEYSYEDKKEIIESLTAENYNVENQKRFVLIIDEINRGNVSNIFGELITLIEDDKRLGKDEALKAKLPYSKDSFGVPPNIYIIGTMNTADRSIEALDTALRRRFSFVPKMPEESTLGLTTDGIDLSKILQTINTRLRVLKDNDHTIGHAWFWNVTDIKGLKKIYDNKILPLLQEYFYNDYEKLGLVLGDAFFKKQMQINSNIFASFSGGNSLAGQYDQSWQFELKSGVELSIADFKSLEIQINTLLFDEDE
ncbi:McrB family protein [Chitinophaga sancti]|uniref:AAA domain (Dynein-related subfamily) n=1 Tax=Chitinophaga sancti TaxID=1004 RepID=A0A1K1T1B0_9BACT|nr:AAA family ATPase [Chitinophaga sancti]WQD61002.1 AAA family ATPase [Chitinophaga sancti]WQG86871.1 AAA family ATPase [Chitinophaga sancti]SFW90384.1 AAA domain (dynein-related subfamily) [Chitinophaga sancti]